MAEGNQRLCLVGEQLLHVIGSLSRPEHLPAWCLSRDVRERFSWSPGP